MKISRYFSPAVLIGVVMAHLVTNAVAAEQGIGLSVPTSAMVNISTSISVSYTADAGVTGCQLYVDGTERGAMTITGGMSGMATGTHTFSEAGTHQVQARCTDGAGAVYMSPPRDIVVASFSGLTNMITSQTTFSLEELADDAGYVFDNDTRETIELRNGRACELSVADGSARVKAALGTISNVEAKVIADNFVACGTRSTRHLGAGERLGSINSFRSAFGRLPWSEDDWFDIIKIANGRYPSNVNAAAETRAKASFKKVYLRDANMNVAADKNAVTVMAYGLRPLPRNLNAEIAATATFRAVYYRGPASATDWDIVRAIAYSGATR